MNIQTNDKREVFMKKIIFIILLVTITFTNFAHAETLKKYATVCRTKQQLKEITENRNDKAYVIKMLQDGKCKMLLSDSVVPVQHLEGVMPLIKIKMQWGEETFIGWTDTTNIK
jgi:high-affinity K+ transport system ATPase subunit B